MILEAETFLLLSNIAWTAISSIATLFAVLVALFLPFYQECKRKKNLSELLNIEINENIQLVKRTLNLKDGQVSRLNLICGLARNINLMIWNDHKQDIAEISSKRYSDFKVINNCFENIKQFAADIDAKQGNSPYAYLIETEITKCIDISKKYNF